MKIRNWKNTVNNLKRLVGVRVDSKEWEHEKQFCLFDVVEGKDGFINVEVGSGDRQVMRPEQVIAMVLHKLSTYADREANADAGIKTGIKLVDFVLSVPPYYSAFQRKLLTQATTLSGLNCLTLVTEGTAVALGWGIFQTDLPEKVCCDPSVPTPTSTHHTGGGRYCCAVLRLRTLRDLHLDSEVLEGEHEGALARVRQEPRMP